MFYLDKFRQVVSEIGNALGYVRMVRTAGMHAAAEAVKFVPDLTAIISFEEAAKLVTVKLEHAPNAPADAPSQQGPGLSAETLAAAKALDAVVSNLTASFAEGVDYFQVLVSVFQHVLLAQKPAATPAPTPAEGAAAVDNKPSEGEKQKAKEDGHLRNFFLIIPALTLNFVDNLRTAKDRMEKGVKVWPVLKPHYTPTCVSNG
jgi:WASH complex subunit 7